MIRTVSTFTPLKPSKHWDCKCVAGPGPNRLLLSALFSIFQEQKPDLALKIMLLLVPIISNRPNGPKQLQGRL